MEELRRRSAWEENLFKIYQHNLMAAAGHYTFTLRDNDIADLTTRQYKREMVSVVATKTNFKIQIKTHFFFFLQVKLTPHRRTRTSDHQMVSAVLHDPHKIPKKVDYRESGFLTKPENQRRCGSCYAYAVAGSIEGQIFRQTGQVVPLSEQQLVDCSTSTGNQGCRGGSLRNTFRYLERSRGLMAQANYPTAREVISYSCYYILCVYSKTYSLLLPLRGCEDYTKLYTKTSKISFREFNTF